jgi:anaerobic selenocysteine-containing dehydrogenase
MTTPRIVRTGCPHDCPSACALEVERLGDRRIGAVRGARDNGYTLGVTCAKVARYAERVHHPDRLRTPMRRVGAKGDGDFRPIGWDDALDAAAEGFARAAQRRGSEAVWPFHSGGTLGVLQRYGLERLRHDLRYSGQHTSICVTIGMAGWRAGVGRVIGPDPREMAEADLIVIWGTNPVSTQVNVMSHVARARKARGARLVVVDCYRTPTAANADEALLIRPGTDGALACAVMHVLLAEGYADRDYLTRSSDFDAEVEAHLATRTPAWAAAITGLDADRIVAFAREYGATERAFIRVGLGFSRSRNGASNLHAVTCLPTVTGAWQRRGGGAFFANIENRWLDNTLIQGLDVRDPAIRVLDQSRIGAVLTGDADALAGGPPVDAILIQNANPAVTSPDTAAVHAGLGRDDLFVCVHEQFPTETTRFADILLPATTFLEHDDLLLGWGHTHLVAAPRVIEPLGEARSNHDLLCGLARRLGADHPGFAMTAREVLDATLAASGLPDFDTLARDGWSDRAPDFAAAHFLDGFPTPDGRFRFKPPWAELGRYPDGLPALPDHAATIDAATPERPFRLVAPPSRSFLNTSFSETPTSRRREGAPTLIVAPGDAAALALGDGAEVEVGNARGSVRVRAVPSDRVLPGTVVLEGVWPNAAFAGGVGINLLIDGRPVPPDGGAAFHDTAVWVRRRAA